MNSGQVACSTYRLDLAYDGRAYFGWQRLADKPTVQGTVEGAITTCFGVWTALYAAGRTDRGAHANGQVATVELPVGLEPEEARAALERELPEDIRVLAVTPVTDFHARSSAKAKTYRYVIWNAPDCPEAQIGLVWHIPEPLDVLAMGAACEVFVGQHDFASFAKKPNFKQATTVRHVYSVELLHDPQSPERIEICMRADSFLWKMVRNIVRAIVKVGEGRHTVDQLAAILAAKDRSQAHGTAPASGLFLENVEY